MKHFRLFGFVALTALLTQCYPGGADYVEELDLVYSRYDTEKNFKEEKTYAMPDSIMKIDDDLLEGGDAKYMKDVYAKPMLKRIADNMAANGWTKVDISKTPDVWVIPTAFELTSTYVYNYYPYYDWWYGGYYPGYGGGWYYPYPVVESYTTGSLLVNMVDANEESASENKRVLWTFVVNGLMEGSTTNFQARVNKGIDQAFKQSQYLKIN